MKRKSVESKLGALGRILGLIFAALLLRQPGGPVVTAQSNPGGTPQFRISSPVTHKNLTISLIEGSNRMSRNLLTLQEALAQKKVVVHETGDVGELAIENLSADEEVYVQSGEIVKGGRQDRTLVTDLIVPPKSGRMPLASFCVEQGRWTRRGQEAATHFSSSDNMLVTKELKLATKHKGEQQEVWNSVAVAQAKLSDNVALVAAGEGGGAGADSGRARGPARVLAAASPTSLQLSLENKQVESSVEEYVNAFAKVLQGKPDAIGYAYAINGKLNSAEVYASSVLFRKLWPKLLKSSATEAVAEWQNGRTFATVTTEAARAFLADAERGQVSKKPVTKRITTVKHESEKNLLFETRDQTEKDKWVHRSYMTK